MLDKGVKMKLSAKEFYLLFTNHKFKKVTETLQDGLSGMYFVLRILSDAENELSAGDIAAAFNVTTARTAVILSTLEKKGFITKSKSSQDARRTIVKITEDGKAALEERKNKLFVEVDSFLSKLTKGEVKEFYKILQKLLTL